jgi:hypothetical protein
VGFFVGGDRFAGADEDGVHAEAAGGSEIVLAIVADHHDLPRGDADQPQRLAEEGERGFADRDRADAGRFFERGHERTTVELHPG